MVDEDRPGAFGSYAASAGQIVPVTFTVTTGKGRHVYFRQPPGGPLGNSIGALAGRGMDVRGSGGFVVGPGSVHYTGARYSTVNAAVPVAPAPGWLAGALLTSPAAALGHPPVCGCTARRMGGCGAWWRRCWRPGWGSATTCCTGRPAGQQR